MQLRLAITVIAVSSCLVIPPDTQAQTQLPPFERHLDTFQDWEAQVAIVQGTRSCYARSSPIMTVGRRTGVPSVFIAHWNSPELYNQVSFYTGYLSQPGSMLQITIDQQTFQLTVNEQWAYLPENEDLRPMVLAIRRGIQMNTEGISQQGTRYSSTYSLSGSSKALSTIDEACDVPPSERAN